MEQVLIEKAYQGRLDHTELLHSQGNRLLAELAFPALNAAAKIISQYFAI